LITLLTATFVVLFVGSVLFMVGALPSVVNVLLYNASLLPAKSVTLPVCRIKLYLVPLVKLLVGFIVSMLPLIDLVNGIFFPPPLSSIQ
jgi:hypothetical protein